MLRPLLEAEMLKNCTPLWHEAHFEVKTLKAPHVRATFGRSDVLSCTLSKMSRSTLHIRQMEWKKSETHWYEAISSALNFPFLKEVSQNCFVFDVVNFEN